VAWSDPDALGGWAIPAATDIAFALAALSLLGSRVPLSLKVFLSALAIIDDLGAVLIIAVFYTGQISWLALGLAGLAVVGLCVLNRSGVRALWPYLLIAPVLWLCLLNSGVHATLAGVILAMTIPLRVPGPPALSPLLRLEHGLQPFVACLVVPLFGLCNAGLPLAGLSLRALGDPVPLGIILGLVVGKPVGVIGASLLMMRAYIGQIRIARDAIEQVDISRAGNGKDMANAMCG
jgi:NhaA family Na+:H+ antiporter